VVLNNGQVHYFGNGNHCYKERNGSFTIKGHKIQSIALGYFHNIMVTMKGAIFGFGSYHAHQLGVVDPSALSGDTVSTPTEVFATVTKFKGVA
jgi:alpha-tubulin suppressor-like RCC1 family protein